jgi:hypothetical protein
VFESRTAYQNIEGVTFLRNPFLFSDHGQGSHQLLEYFRQKTLGLQAVPGVMAFAETSAAIRKGRAYRLLLL